MASDKSHSLQENWCMPITFENQRSNLLEEHYNMRSQVKGKLTNVLGPILQIPAPTKPHYWFALFLDPRYVVELKDIKTFHQSKNVDTKVIVQNMMPKFYEYIMAAEFSFHLNTPHKLARNNKESL